MQAAREQENDSLVRKQYLLSTNNIRKLELLAKDRKTSAAEIVRLAIEAYDPHGAGNMDSVELMELVSGRLKEAINSTQHANKKVADTLNKLEQIQSSNNG